MEPDSDKRRFEREWRGQLLLTSPVSGRIVDMNLAGIGIETREPLNVRTLNEFICASAGARMEFLGEVRWCRLVDSIPQLSGDRSPVYRAGIAFVDRQLAE